MNLSTRSSVHRSIFFSLLLFFACILKRINHLSKHDCLLYLLEDTELTEKKKVIKRKLRNIFKCQYYTFASTLDLGTDKTIWHSPRQDSGDEFEQSTHYLLQKLENLRDYKRTLYFNFFKILNNKVLNETLNKHFISDKQCSIIKINALCVNKKEKKP